jgi:hypothetical protein
MKSVITGANRPIFEFVPITKLKASDDGARTHNKKQLNKIVTSLRAFGQVNPLVIDEHGGVIDGNARLEVLKACGFDEVAVMRVTGLTGAEIKALRLALNRIPQDAGWENEKLREVFQALVEAKMDIDLTGFDAVEVDHILEIDYGGDTIEEVDDVPSPASRAVSRPGDIWMCGRHRVGCGDALDLNAVQMLLAGIRPAMSFIDPPYNVPIHGFASGKGATRHREFAQASGEMSEAQFIAFLDPILTVLKSVMTDGGLIYACMDWRHRGGIHYCISCSQCGDNDLIRELFRLRRLLNPQRRRLGSIVFTFNDSAMIPLQGGHSVNRGWTRAD